MASDQSVARNLWCNDDEVFSTSELVPQTDSTVTDSYDMGRSPNVRKFGADRIRDLGSNGSDPGYLAVDPDVPTVSSARHCPVRLTPSGRTRFRISKPGNRFACTSAPTGVTRIAMIQLLAHLEERHVHSSLWRLMNS